MFSFIPRRKIVFLIADAILIVLANYLAFLLRFEGGIPSKYFLNFVGMSFAALIIFLPIFYFFKLYSFSWTYVSAPELISLAKALFFSFVLLAALIFLLRDLAIFNAFPRSTLFISLILLFISSGGIRFSKRIYLQLFRAQKTAKERTLIVGAGDAGEQILRSILSFRGSPYFPVGFVDDDPAKQGVLIQGIKVFGRISDIPRIIVKEDIEGMIIALPSAGSKIIGRAVELGRDAKLKKIRIIPSIGEIISGQVSIGNLRDVQMNDLLGRDPVYLDRTAIESFLRAKRILVTGAAGSIGSELCRQIIKFRPQALFLLDQDETGIFNISNELKNASESANNIFSLVADICDKERMERIFDAALPQVVFHAAAYKHVPLMEEKENVSEAIKNNIFGTKNIVDISLKNGAEKLILISTDKAVNPTSVMGATKRAGEMLCCAANRSDKTKFVSVRFGNVLDSRGSVIPIFREQIKQRGPVTITHPEMKRYFMTAREACLLVMQAGAMGQGGEVFVLDMGKPIKILDLAKEMIRLSGFEPDKDIPIVFTNPRPGEKLFEEILTAEEGTLATQNQKIFIAKLPFVDEGKIIKSLDELKRAVEIGDKSGIIGILKELIPNYTSNKSAL